jgi:hypothetical protein
MYLMSKTRLNGGTSLYGATPTAEAEPRVRSVPQRWEDPLTSELSDWAEPPTPHYEPNRQERSIIATADDPRLVAQYYALQERQQERFWLRHRHSLIDQRHLHP